MRKAFACGLQVALMAGVCLIGVAAPAGCLKADAAAPVQDLRPEIKAKTRALATEVIEFWRTRGPDVAGGGFYGSHDLDGRPDPAADKGVIQQARHLWTFALLASLDYGGLGAQYRQICASTYAFLTKFYEQLAGFFVFRLNAAGTAVTDRTEQFYANAYAIYGLSQYALMSGETEATCLAMAAYQTMMRRGFDAAYGGFDQSND